MNYIALYLPGLIFCAYKKGSVQKKPPRLVPGLLRLRPPRRRLRRRSQRRSRRSRPRSGRTPQRRSGDAMCGRHSGTPQLRPPPPPLPLRPPPLPLLRLNPGSNCGMHLGLNSGQRFNYIIINELRGNSFVRTRKKDSYIVQEKSTATATSENASQSVFDEILGPKQSKLKSRKCSGNFVLYNL